MTTAKTLPATETHPDAVGAPLDRTVRRQCVGRRLGDLSDLPPQLRALLSKRKALQDQVCDALAALEGVATTDELLVMVYRQTGCICQRRPFEVTLYKAAKCGLIGVRKLGNGRTNRRRGVVGKVWTLTPNAELTGRAGAAGEGPR
jgi:hypothetical protein